MDEATIAFMIWLHDYWAEDNDLSDLDAPWVDRMHDLWFTGWLPSLNEPHGGDCTKAPGPCTRCHTEAILVTAKKFANAINN